MGNQTIGPDKIGQRRFVGREPCSMCNHWLIPFVKRKIAQTKSTAAAPTLTRERTVERRALRAEYQRTASLTSEGISTIVCRAQYSVRMPKRIRRGENDPNSAGESQAPRPRSQKDAKQGSSNRRNGCDRGEQQGNWWELVVRTCRHKLWTETDSVSPDMHNTIAGLFRPSYRGLSNRSSSNNIDAAISRQ